MPNYKKMYFALLNAVNNAIRDLQEAQQEGEECYIECDLLSPQFLQAPTEKEETTTE